jgi:putative heme-binding domain-containing protein
MLAKIMSSFVRLPSTAFALFISCCILLVNSKAALAVEPWASKQLSVTNGLELWLDASKEIAAHAYNAPRGILNETTAKISNGGPLDCWHDASGNKHDLFQVVPGARPHFFTTATGGVVKFDGVDDFLSATGIKEQMAETTIFIVAAPRANKNPFSALLAFNRAEANDYVSGMNVDMAAGAKNAFDFLNVEGAGFAGVRNFMSGSFPFGETHLLTIMAEAGTNATQVWIDGRAQAKESVERASREKKSGPTFGFDQITVGARFYSNTAEPAHVQGFLEGDIIEVLLYNRILSVEERSQVENYLKSKLVSQFPGRTLAPLVAVSNPPPVQMFLPGFTVRELPLTLNNINCIKYREDGKLVALGYDGTIWLLSDSDGDGLEDKATAFWNKQTLRSPIGMALTPPNYAKGRGVFVPSKGKLSLIVDTNADDVADQEIVVAMGWPESSHGVGALGTAIDKEGNVYFGLGTASFTGAYLVGQDGKSHYDLKDERGTIMKVSADLSKREIFCTGIRYPVAMAFNSLGDLFSTDQEGATWLPNGNPFDELLHIEKGRHYGFPPRHPKYLPGVIDEPSVFDYGPQHQSTCGLNFNEPVNGGPTFGPSWWHGNAFISGYSRAKLFRTELVKTPAGYVAQSQLIAALNRLTVDACVSPQGDLVVSVHSGNPDWGSGPTGVGKLYKISYTDKGVAQPVAIWASSPTETQIEFDRPLDSKQVGILKEQIAVTQGKYVSAGDEFETIRPGYQAVQNQSFQPRYSVKVLSTALSADGRSLVIRTEPRSEATHYAISFPRGGQAVDAGRKELVQLPRIDLAHELTGVEAEWWSSSGKESSSIWLPHLDLNVARAFTKASHSHERFWAQAAKPGKLKIRAQLDLWQMLRAATQPDSKLDFEYPDETVTVVLKSSVPLQVQAPTMKLERRNGNEVLLTGSPKENGWFPLEVTLQSSAKVEPTLDVAWFTAEDNRLRALPERRILVPWAICGDKGAVMERSIPEIAGGNWLRGRRLFFTDQAACYKCHTVQAQGGKGGPDLSNLIQRDYASVLKDITRPSAAINPDHVAYNVELKDGESFTGVLVGSGEQEAKFSDATGKIKAWPKSQIVSMKPSTISLMPEGLLDGLSGEQRKDLLTFLLMPTPLEPATLEIGGEPPPRKRAEVDKILNGAKQVALEKLKPLKIVLCSGPKDHGPSEHDYPVWRKRWSTLLSLSENVLIETADEWPSPKQFKNSDLIVFYSDNPGWSTERAGVLDKFLNRGGGLVYIHYAVDGHDHCEELAQRIGLAWRGGASAFRHGALDLQFQLNPITEGFSETHFVDESYWNLIGSETNICLLASGKEGEKMRPLMWTREQGKGRVFVSIPGHYTWTFDDPLFRLLILRGMAWSAHESVDRFNELATVGARVGE